MSDWNLGSVGTQIHNMIPNVPATISGGTLLSIVDQRRLKIEDYTGTLLGSTAIPEKYAECLVNLSLAKVLPLVHLQGGDTSIGGVRLGMSAMDAAKYFEDEGKAALARLGMKSTIGKAFG